MLNDLKKLPDDKKRLLSIGVTMTSSIFLLCAFFLWFFKEDAMKMMNVDSFSIDLLAGLLCIMVVIDLVFVKIIVGEDKAR